MSESEYSYQAIEERRDQIKKRLDERGTAQELIGYVARMRKVDRLTAEDFVQRALLEVAENELIIMKDGEFAFNDVMQLCKRFALRIDKPPEQYEIF